MGGKTKTQRTKNNVRPSNSGRSAELLGSTILPFVGFGAGQSEFGLLSSTIGLDTLPETFDPNVSAQYQMVMRKMSKKDPITKVKAMQEFQTLVSETDKDTIKVILPIWPKFYNNLSNDVEHKVRETAQQTNNTVVTKAGKTIAPFLKQLAPTWISSQFDNYAPAASIALTSFKSSFSENKIQDVMIFCQTEILDYISKNLTFHTPQTLNSNKTYSNEDAENKYQRLVLVTLKTFSLFIERTKVNKSNTEIFDKIQILLKNPKFWSYAKNKIPNIKAAWFELLSTIFQHSTDLFESMQNQVMQTCFQNIDESDSLISPHVWSCILSIQITYKNWYNQININTIMQTKLTKLFKNMFNGSATAVGPNLLPFLANISKIDGSKDLKLFEFYNEFLMNIKNSIMIAINVQLTSKSDISALVTAFYECLRFIFKNINAEFQEGQILHKIVAFDYLQNHIMSLIEWSLKTDHMITKYIFLHSSALIAYWSNHTNSEFYSELLKKFWSEFFNCVTVNAFSFETDMNDKYIMQIVEFIDVLHNATPSLMTNHKVKFVEENKSENYEKIKCTPENIQIELKNVVIKLVKMYLENTAKGSPFKHIVELKKLCDIFGDTEFFVEISEEKTLLSTLKIFKNFLTTTSIPSEEIIDIIFDIICLLEKKDKFVQLREILKINVYNVQEIVLQRMLSYPLCIEPEVREILSEPNCMEIIICIANEVIKDKSKEKLNILHKCFFQIETGQILINAETVNGIMKLMTQPLLHPNKYENMIDICGRFISQNMAVICSENSENSTKELQNELFLILFGFSISTMKNENLSSDTYWEIITCWQDALSSNDIIMDDDMMLECSKIILQQFESEKLKIDIIADMASKLILCSTEKVDNDEQRYQQIDKYLLNLFSSYENENSYKQLHNLCTFYELMEKITTPANFNADSFSIDINEISKIFSKMYFKFLTIFKLICNTKDDREIKIIEKDLNVQEDDNEHTEDYCDPEENLLKLWSDDIYKLLMFNIRDAAMGESLLKTSSTILNDSTKTIIKNLLEKIKKLFQHSKEENINNLKNRLIDSAVRSNDISWIRTLPFLLFTKPYNMYEENASILLFEDLSETFLESDAMGYVNFSEVMLTRLSPRTLRKPIDLLTNNNDLLYRSSYYRIVLVNHLATNFNELTDKELIKECINFITEIGEQTNKEFLLYNDDISKHEFKDVLAVTEFIKLLKECLDKFPTELNIKNWDTIRIGLCSWVLSVSKSIENFSDTKVTVFISACYELFATLLKFINPEKTKSSTQYLTNIIDEWENVFSREVNLVLFKSFYTLISSNKQQSPICYNSLAKVIGSAVEYIDYNIIFNACKTGFKISLNDLINCLLENINNIHCIRKASTFILKSLSHNFISLDMEILEKRNEDIRNNSLDSNNWHYLNKFTPYVQKYGLEMEKYLPEFSYKLTELTELNEIKKEDAFNYFYIWNCIIDVCSKAPGELRSIYASWISDDNKYEQILLNSLFRAMPIEILRNYDSKPIKSDKFKFNNWNQMNDYNVSVDRYACFMYFQMLRHLPAVVRKWWSSSNARQKLFVDKLTMNYVSNLIWQEDLHAINKKEKHENMQITVHSSTREVIAIYSIDEARMELIITLAQNHPLGAVKVESGKQIGGKALCRNVGMQLTIFLTHQNGSIYDGLSLWKKNLDKKFSGVEECYVCYTVIHQDTCQLPRLTCKTCKKKFHGPCLYKWFTTSSKSTCPLCRNVF